MGNIILISIKLAVYKYVNRLFLCSTSPTINHPPPPFSHDRVIFNIELFTSMAVPTNGTATPKASPA